MQPIRFTRKSFLVLTAITFCVGVAAPAARADLVGTPIAPLQEVVPLANAPGNLATEILLGTDLVNPALGNALINANLANAVYMNSAGFIDVLFQLRNEANSVPISSIAVNNYGGFVTGVGYITAGALPANAPFVQPTGGALPPTLAQRGAAGADISFTGFTIPAGSTSNIFFVTTNATSFNQLGAALASATTQSNGGAVFVQKFQPANVAIPEPPATVMMGLVSLAGLGYHKFRKVRVQA